MKLVKFTRQVLLEETFIKSVNTDPHKLEDSEIDSLFEKQGGHWLIDKKVLNTTDHGAWEIIPEYQNKYLDLAGQAMINRFQDALMKPGGEYDREKSQVALFKIELDDGFKANIKKSVMYRNGMAHAIELKMDVFYKTTTLYEVSLMLPIHGLEDHLGLEIFYASWKKMIHMMEEMGQAYRYPFGSDFTNNKHFTYYNVAKAFAMFKRGEDITSNEAFRIIDRFNRHTAETTEVW